MQFLISSFGYGFQDTYKLILAQLHKKWMKIVAWYICEAKNF